MVLPACEQIFYQNVVISNSSNVARLAFSMVNAGLSSPEIVWEIEIHGIRDMKIYHYNSLTSSDL